MGDTKAKLLQLTSALPSCLTENTQAVTQSTYIAHWLFVCLLPFLEEGEGGQVPAEWYGPGGSELFQRTSVSLQTTKNNVRGQRHCLCVLREDGS